MFDKDNRIVLTLDAGGTNFVFSAMQANRIIVHPISRSANSEDLDTCLNTIINSFSEVIGLLPEPPVAISFAFPGPADYKNGVIGDLPNFPSFRGGIALGPLLEKTFGIPVFINNDGNLFAYGEAMSGLLPRINKQLEGAGSSRKFENMVGITLGTGFGAGVVINNNILFGDNGCGGDVWILKNKFYPDMIAEESVSIRAVKRVYQELSGIKNQSLEPKDIFDIAEGKKEGDMFSAIQSFATLGEALGDSLSQIATFTDGLISIGGGVAGAAKYIYPAMFKEINRKLGTFAGDKFPRMQSQVFNLDDEQELSKFLHDELKTVTIPNTNIQVPYVSDKKIGIGTSRCGTNQAVLLGAYAYALQQLDK
ncbi:MAG: ROK family protein [Dysgonomonas sp.]|nr:ROK family protein [Dysgonomonas sp.]